MLGCFFRTLGFLLSGIPYNFVIVRISIMIGADIPHFRFGLVFDENIQVFIFANTALARRGIVKPKIRHLIDFFLDGL